MIMRHHFTGIDILRVFSAMGICAYHYFFIGVIQGFYAPEVFAPFAFWGEIGVDIFFLISGFLILVSCQNRTWKEFIKSRFIRIFPVFFTASILTFLIGLIMPDTSWTDLESRLAASWTFFPELFHKTPLSSIYWTLNVEIRFYLLAAVIMKTGIWRHHKDKVLLLWLLIGVADTLYVQNTWIKLFLDSTYAGHFVLGIIAYRFLCEHEKSPLFYVEIPLCMFLIYKNIWSYTSWIRGIYAELPFTDVELLLATIVVAGLLFCCADWKTGHSFKIMQKLSTLSFPFYLIHADLGYFIRTQFYNRLVPKYIYIYNLLGTFREPLLMITGIAMSILLALALNQVGKTITHLSKSKH